MADREVENSSEEVPEIPEVLEPRHYEDAV